MQAPADPVPRTVTATVVEFTNRLRQAGVGTSLAEAIDAIRALHELELLDRQHIRGALGATMVKNAAHRATFDRIFDLHFAPGPEVRATADPEATRSSSSVDDDHGGERSGDERRPDASSQDLPSDTLMRALLDALKAGDVDALRELAGDAVAAFGGIDGERSASERYYLYRVLRKVELSNLLQAAIRAGLEDPGSLEGRLEQQELSERVESLRKMIAQEIRRQMTAVAGRIDAAEKLGPDLLEEAAIAAMSPRQLEELRDAVRPLARKLAARVAAKHRRHSRGRLDVRRTMRRSLSTGGVPLDPAFKRPKVSKPELALLCDISGSMAEFASFTMSFLHAMSEELVRLRSFAFVDAVDEVTDLFEPGEPTLHTRNVLAAADVIHGDGHSDYGQVLDQFWEEYEGYLSSKSTLIITGDARTNYRDAGVERLRQLQRRVRKIYWLNPEPRPEWDTKDSVMGEYARVCDGVFEVRNLRQLENAVYEIV
ncbi:MAG: VWA domain-containing protein [Actinobacteria bacterium]|nr:VWA domain-containing protein [Actinomycetota bacterium]